MPNVIINLFITFLYLLPSAISMAAADDYKLELVQVVSVKIFPLSPNIVKYSNIIIESCMHIFVLNKLRTVFYSKTSAN